MNFDDSIITDTAVEKQQNMAEVAADLMEATEYRVNGTGTARAVRAARLGRTARGQMLVKLFREYVGDALAGVAVAVGVGRVRHLGVSFRVVEQAGELTVDRLLPGADETKRSRLDALWAFGGIAHDEHGFTQARSLFLDAS